MRIMALGDSNTYGVIDTLNRESGGYRIKLDAKLAAAGITADFVGSQSNGPSSDNQHEGYSRMTIDWLAGKAHEVVPIYKPDVVLVMAGNNDLAGDSIATMKSDMATLIDTLSNVAPNATILVATIPPPRPDNTVNQSPLKAAEFNAALPSVVATKAAAGIKVSLVDTTSLTIDDMSPVGPDKGVHLSEQGYEKLATMWFDAIKKFDGDQGSAPPPTGDVDSPVIAADDFYALDAGKSLYFAAKYLIMNDKGADGGLQITSIAGTSEHGVTVKANPDGSYVYKAPMDWDGIDRINYTLVDKDGSTDTGTINITIKGGAVAAPPPPPPSNSGTGNPVIAGDDLYSLDAGKSLYFATKYLIMNDKGADGGLKITSVASHSDHGVSITAGPNGSLVYKAPTDWSGTDRIDYMLTDQDGSTDTGGVVIAVKSGTATPAPPPPPPVSSGTGNPVVAADDTYKIGVGQKLYFATKYLIMNDKGLDGGLTITSVASTSEHGVAVTSGPNGSLVYAAPAGFNGIDHVDYVLADKDGSTDIGTLNIAVGIDVFS